MLSVVTSSKARMKIFNQQRYKISPVIAVDLPSLFELNNEVNHKPTIAIIGQDAKSDV